MKIEAQNAIYLGEETGGKGRQFKSRFLVPGLVKYDYGVCLLTKENADKFMQGFIGCPVVINHQDVTDDNVKDLAVGDIFSVWFDDKDGYYWCNGIIRDKYAITLINEGYSVSCQYLITEYSDNTAGALHNGNPYDKVIENGKPEHLAIVKNPRYEGAIIAVNALNISSPAYGERRETVGELTSSTVSGEGQNKTASNSFVSQFKDTLYEVLAEGIYNRLLAINADKWITIKKNGKTWKVKIEEKPENYNADKKQAAWAILSAGTGKKIPWLRMNLKRSEKLQELIEEPDDKLAVTSAVESRVFTTYYPDLAQLNYHNNDDANGAQAAKLLERVYDDLLNDNFYDNSDKAEDEYGEYLAQQAIKDLKSKIQSDYVKDILKNNEKITNAIYEKATKDIEKYPKNEQSQIIDDLDILEEIQKIQDMEK